MPDPIRWSGRNGRLGKSALGVAGPFIFLPVEERPPLLFAGLRALEARSGPRDTVENHDRSHRHRSDG
jgi:hypothetical protein